MNLAKIAALEIIKINVQALVGGVWWWRWKCTWPSTTVAGHKPLWRSGDANATSLSTKQCEVDVSEGLSEVSSLSNTTE